MILTTVEQALIHMQSGDARIRLLSYVSNNEYKYRIKENQNGKVFFVYFIAVTGEMAYMGSIFDGDFKRTDKSRINPSAGAFRAFDWVWRNLREYKMPPQTLIEKL